MSNPPRVAIAQILTKVIEGRSLNALLPAELNNVKDPDKPFCKEVIYGALREWHALLGISRNLLKKPLRSRDRDLLAIICCGIYELDHMGTPDHAAVSEWVNAARILNKTWATGFINRSLRTFQRARSQTIWRCSAGENAALPEWLFDCLQTEYGATTTQISDAMRKHPPMWLRVNQRQVNPTDYLHKIRSLGIKASLASNTGCALLLEQPIEVTALPGFAEGEVSVQDVSAQLAADFLAPQPGERVLDACSAPGGKGCHIMEIEKDLIDLVACDIDANRLEMVANNSRRLNLPMKITRADARDLRNSEVRGLFDAVLADVPCSASGALRRNPDVKLLRKPSDIGNFVTKQVSILEGLWEVLKPGGRMLYVTCSMLDAENDGVINQFINGRDTEIMKIQSAGGMSRKFGWQCIPSQKGGDGLYFSLLKKLKF